MEWVYNIKAGKQDRHNNNDQGKSSLLGIIKPPGKRKIPVKLYDQKKNKNGIQKNISQRRQPC